MEPSASELIPTPPTFVREFAGSLLEFALMEQALELDQVLLIHSEFAGGKQGLNLNWTLLFVPSRDALHVLAASLAQLESTHESTVRCRPCRSQARPIHQIPRAIVSVAIGQWAVAAAPAKIRTLLGSCVGVVLYDRVAKLGGLAHVVLPSSRGVDRPPRQVRRHGDPRRDRRSSSGGWEAKSGCA